MMKICAIDAAKLLELMTSELKLANTLLAVADPDDRDPPDPETAVRILDHAHAELEMVRIFLPAANLPAAERVYIESEVSFLEENIEARHGGQETTRRKERA